MVEISTSLLSIEEDFIKKIYDLEVAHTDYYHIDVMDGKFVANNTAKRMLEYTNNIKQVSNIPIDVHLMVEDVLSYIEDYIPFFPYCITFHLEALKNQEEILKAINKIKESGIKVGISIKPNTEVEEVYKFLHIIHTVLIMTVEPGKGGQELISETLEKVKILKEYRTKNNLDFNIEVDGGINLRTMPKVKEVGPDIAVVGTGIIKSKDYKETIKLLKEE